MSTNGVTSGTAASATKERSADTAQPAARRRRPPAPPTPTVDLPPFTLPRHGGALAHAEKEFGTPRQGWLDLSTGINPNAYPVPDLPAELWQQLPDRDLEQACIEAARQYFGCSNADAVLPAPGTQSLIQWLPWLRAPGTVGILGPTYSEHATAWQAAGHETTEIADLPDWGDFAVVVVTNPNNPDGKRRFREGLLALAEGQAHAGSWLVVDEAFADVDPGISVAAEAGLEGLCVLRSFGKFFGLAGLRLGFALLHTELAAELKTALGPWPVSGPALEIGRAAMTDLSWQQDTRGKLEKRAQEMETLIARHGLKIVGGTPLFQLAAHPKAHDLYRHLAVNGVLIRTFEDQPEWLRFGPPKDDTAIDRLDAALGRFAI